MAQCVGVDVRTHTVQQLQLLDKEGVSGEKLHQLTWSIGKLFWERSKTGRKEVMAENLGRKTIKCCVSPLPILPIPPLGF